MRGWCCEKDTVIEITNYWLAEYLVSSVLDQWAEVNAKEVILDR